MRTSEKLIKLADFLETLPDEKFDFGTYIRETDCGTVGCAAGWIPAAFPDDEEAQRCWTRGLWITSDALCFNESAARAFLQMDPQMKRRPWEHAMRDFDRLFIDDDGKLSSEYDYDKRRVTRTAVIARIRACARAYAERGK